MGDGGGLGAIGRAEFGEDAGDVDLGGAGADREGVADLLIGAAGGEEAEDIELAGGEAARRRALLRLGRLRGVDQLGEEGVSLGDGSLV